MWWFLAGFITCAILGWGFHRQTVADLKADIDALETRLKAVL